MIRRTLIRQSRVSTLFVCTRPISTPASCPRSDLSRRTLQPSNFRPLAPRLFQRWQSTEATEAEKKAENAAPPADRSELAEQPEADLKKELEAKNREIIDLKDKYLRSVAGFRNLQERTKRDVESARQFAIQRFATDLVESIDNLDRALEAVPADSLTPSAETDTNTDTIETADEKPAVAANNNQDLINLHAGLTMTESILMTTLKKHGMERFDPVEAGRKFDPRWDEATFMVKVEGREDGDIILTQSKGFTLHGRVLRAAKVGVVKNSEEA